MSKISAGVFAMTGYDPIFWVVLVITVAMMLPGCIYFPIHYGLRLYRRIRHAQLGLGRRF